MSLLELKEKQEITIEKEKYQIINMIKFTEGMSYWKEYKIKRLKDNKIYYLNIEVNGGATLYEKLQNTKIEPKMNIEFQGIEYKLYEKGRAKVETYYGLTDVALKDEVIYYEYQNDKNEILSIEKWKDEIEISKGKKIQLLDIKY